MKDRPTTIVLFGITGDLAQKKLLPALYDLYTKGKLEKTKIVGFSRREFSKEEIRKFVKEKINDQKFDESFLDSISYVQGEFSEESSYHRLAKYLAEVTDIELGDCSNKLFYLAVPSTLYEVICKNISKSGLSIPCGGNQGFARILIEKPFGKDLETAQTLDLLLGTLFQEEQIYRIDHYLAKESLYKIINVHRRDSDISKKWNKDDIIRVEIDLFEKGTVGSRGTTYDGVGAFRDVGQNHMLQILALVSMDIPIDISHTLSPFFIQKARAEVLENLIPATQRDLKGIKRGQYKGYLLEQGVLPNSTTETFFSITVRLKEGLLVGVPFILRSGKALAQDLTQIRIIFKDGRKKVIDVPKEDSKPAYQKILLDCISGDQTIFISTSEIMAEWCYVTPVVEQMQKNTPFVYDIGTDPGMFF